MSAVDDFLEGFGSDEPDEDELRASRVDPNFLELLEQLDALRAERLKCGDLRWFPHGKDPDGLERLVRTSVRHD